MSRVRAVILAGGASTRMGRAKAALPLTGPSDTFLRRIIGSFRAAGLTDIVVVTGAAADATREAAGVEAGRIRFVHNPDWARGQLTSLLAGLALLPEAGSPADAVDVPLDAALVTLVDVPLVSAATIARVHETWRATRAPIVRPARGHEHGHPVVFDAVLFGELRAADPLVGAKAVVRAHAGEIVNVPIDDPGAFLDVDSEDEYRRLRRELGATPP